MRGDVVRFARLPIVSRLMIAACSMNSSRVCSVQEPLLADVWGGSFTMPRSVLR